jgi:hypothetical protein
LTQVACLSLLKELDAPELRDGFNLNLLDWSVQNVISIALGKSKYAYYVPTSQTARLCDVSGVGNFVTSITWNEQVSHSSFSLLYKLGTGVKSQVSCCYQS